MSSAHVQSVQCNRLLSICLSYIYIYIYIHYRVYYHPALQYNHHNRTLFIGRAMHAMTRAHAHAQWSFTYYIAHTGIETRQQTLKLAWWWPSQQITPNFVIFMVEKSPTNRKTSLSLSVQIGYKKGRREMKMSETAQQTRQSSTSKTEKPNHSQSSGNFNDERLHMRRRCRSICVCIAAPFVRTARHTTLELRHWNGLKPLG